VGPVLEVSNLSLSFATATGLVRAVDDVSLTLGRGETLGLVGESGCGKSSLARSILGLTKPDSGSVRLLGRDITGMPREHMLQCRRDMQMIFQNPSAALNPRLTAGRLIEEPLVVHGLGRRQERRERVGQLLSQVGLRPEVAQRYPHEISGGQRQRVAIARALALSPAVIVCDEPVSALDVSVQAQVINLLRDLQERLGVSYIFISHGLSVTRHISHRVAIMYLGRIVEEGPAREVFDAPSHPYTRALIRAAPRIDDLSAGEAIEMLDGELPSPLAPPPGCHFHTRCPFAILNCGCTVPPLRATGPERRVACHRTEEIGVLTSVALHEKDHIT